MRGTIASACQDTALLHLAGVHSDRKMALHSPSNSHQALHINGDVELTHLRQDNMTLLFQAVRTWRVLSSLVDAERRGRQAGSRGVKLTWRSLGQISLALTCKVRFLPCTFKRRPAALIITIVILLVNHFAGPISGDSRHGIRRRFGRQSGLKAHLPTVSIVGYTRSPSSKWESFF